jgi:hypothetical protein
VAAVGLKPGQFPPDLQSGNLVTVVVAPAADAGTSASSSGTASSGPSSWEAVVLGVRTNSTDQTTVVSLQLAEADARQLAAAPAGQISVVVVHGGGGR